MPICSVLDEKQLADTIAQKFSNFPIDTDKIKGNKIALAKYYNQGIRSKTLQETNTESYIR